MSSKSTPARLRQRILRTSEDDYPATCRELALAYTRQCPRSSSGWAFLASALIELSLFSKARAALRRLDRRALEDGRYQVCVRYPLTTRRSGVGSVFVLERETVHGFYRLLLELGARGIESIGVWIARY